jgi:carboxymethylenebutenolidase
MSTETPLSIHEPTGTPKGGIVVAQEGFGVNDHIEDVCRRFAAEGWLAVAPHLFHRNGDPVIAYDDMDGAVANMGQLTVDSVLADVDAALAALASKGISADRAGIVGFCMGGTVALAVTARRDIGAGVTFYGSGVKFSRFGFDPLEEEAKRLRAPWLGLFGDLDHGIPVEDVEDLRVAAASSGQPTEVVRYPEAGHGFHCDAREGYHEASAKDAWQRALAWFDRYLSGGRVSA